MAPGGRCAGVRMVRLLLGHSYVRTSSRFPPLLQRRPYSLAHRESQYAAPPSRTLDTRGLRSVIDLLLRTTDEPRVSTKGNRFIHDAQAFVSDPSGESGSTFCSYADLYREAGDMALALQKEKDVKRRVIMCHSNSHREQITLFWACILADAIPCPFPQLAYDIEQRTPYLEHLRNVLVAGRSLANSQIQPLAIVSERLKHELECCSDLEVTSIEALKRTPISAQEQHPIGSKGDQWDQVLCLHMTSGSTGFPKVVVVTHGNALTASAGKSAIHGNTASTNFLNWLAMDHVAALTEMHIRPLFTGAQQIHVPATTVLADPTMFLRIIERAQINHAFGPMFFLSALLRALRASKSPLDIRLPANLRIVSGGEQVNTATCTELVQYLTKMGAPDNVIIPAYGLTETCAGFCFHFDFPREDIAFSRKFGAHGLRNPGTQVRIIDFKTGEPKPPGVPGELQLRGPNISPGYWNNLSATSQTFTADGWFRTGDTGYLTADPDNGHHEFEGDDGRLLVILGRDRDSLVLDGKKYALEELISHIQDAEVPGLDPLWVTMFPIDQSDATRGFVIIYRPTYDPLDNPEQHAQTVLTIHKCCTDWSPLRPKAIIGIPEERFVPKTTIGKLSRFKMRQMYMADKFQDVEMAQNNVLNAQGVQLFVTETAN